jgi:iron(III) transport system ATP-binding protein
MIALHVEKLSKTYPGKNQAEFGGSRRDDASEATKKHPAVHDLNFTLEKGEILVLVGPSGCGKTTTLRLIAGLEMPDSGIIRIGEQVVAGVGQFIPPERRGIGMVFQDHALFPHLTVAQNVAFGLKSIRPAANSQQQRQAATEMLRLVELEHLADRYPHALSGGERQRVALARALAPRPLLALMDEPFSSLDAGLRNQVRQQVRSILKSIHASVVFVTHDQEEALYMGDRLAVFANGRIEQIGRPEEIFHHSATRFVAEFMGESDFLHGKATLAGVQTAIGSLPAKDILLGDRRVGADLPGSNLQDGMAVEIAVRADDIDFTSHPESNSVIVERFFRGAFNVYRLQLDSGQTLHAIKPHSELLPVGERVRTFLNAGHPLCAFERYLNSPL